MGVFEQNIEFKWAIQQLLAMGYIQLLADDKFALTDAGEEAAIAIRDRHGVMERILLLLLFE